ncbi:MAG: hypothetical protein ABTQ25_15650, partial [Nitrosomonas ureae]
SFPFRQIQWNGLNGMEFGLFYCCQSRQQLYMDYDGVAGGNKCNFLFKTKVIESGYSFILTPLKKIK